MKPTLKNQLPIANPFAAVKNKSAVKSRDVTDKAKSASKDKPKDLTDKERYAQLKRQTEKAGMVVKEVGRKIVVTKK